MDADDCDVLRGDPLFKLALDRAPESGRDLCSQPTMSRLENASSRIEVARVTAALFDIICCSFPVLPAAITLDIDNTCDAVHAHLRASQRTVGIVVVPFKPRRLAAPDEHVSEFTAATRRTRRRGGHG